MLPGLKPCPLLPYSRVSECDVIAPRGGDPAGGLASPSDLRGQWAALRCQLGLADSVDEEGLCGGRVHWVWRHGGKTLPSCWIWMREVMNENGSEVFYNSHLEKS